MAFEALAPAKVNLILEVLGQRPDGYHEVATVMQTIALTDRVRLEPSTSIELDVEGSEIAGVPLEGPENLAYKAALILHEQTGSTAGVRIVVEKAVPVGMGLGGGSTDAAAVLRGLNRFWDLGLETEALAEVGARVGSDVAFFVYGGTAIARGRGEVVQPLPDYPPQDITLFVSSIDLPQKTRLMYSLLTPSAFTDGHRGHVAETMIGRALRLTETDIFNAFDRYIEEAAPEVGRAMQNCRDMGVPVWACGSGPGFFALQAMSDLPPLLGREMAHHGIRMVPTRTLTRDEALALREV